MCQSVVHRNCRVLHYNLTNTFIIQVTEFIIAMFALTPPVVNII